MAEPQRLVNIWEDTVDLRHLLIGLACGSALGFTSYVLALRAFTAYFPGETPGLIKGYALMIGIAGCVMAAAIIGTVFKPKRVFRDTDEGPIDRSTMIRNLALDPDEERRALETASPKLIREMQELQVYDFFVDGSRSDPR
ncbi:MAG: hypothetical protein K2Y23_20820 [Cyanobacteria bacterium]|nr:hypothetical protein [Cyanobacteriota bacterium]